MPRVLAPDGRCSVCSRKHYGFLAEHGGEEVVCLGCVARIADELEGDTKFPRCVCGRLINDGTDMNGHTWLECHHCWHARLRQ